MKTAEEQAAIDDLRRFEKYGCNMSNSNWFKYVRELIESKLDARAELEQQNQMLREAAKTVADALAVFRGMNRNDRIDWANHPSTAKRLSEVLLAALSTTPPTQKWVRKEVADKTYTELSNLYQNGCLDLSHDWMDDINKALTAYEQETK